MTRQRSNSRRQPLPYLEGEPPRVFAHRGLALEAPENTLLAFAKAIAAGATHIETDVHASADGVAVISHDPDLSRLTNRPERVSDFTMDELRKLQLGSDQVFCSLGEALDAFPGARFNIDIKSADAVGPTVDAVRAANATDRVLITSFSETRRAAAVRMLPGVATSASASLFLRAILAAKLGLVPLVRRILRNVDAVQVPERAVGLRITTSRMVGILHSANVEVHVWTINEQAVMERLLDLGVDGIVTDRTDLAVGVLEARTRRAG
jgi:glycerophosphoryl diester phosphodiesterase